MLDSISDLIIKVFAKFDVLLVSTVILLVFGLGLNYWRQARRLLRLEWVDLGTLKENLRKISEETINDPRFNLERPLGIVRQRIEKILDLKEGNGRLDMDALSQISETQLTRYNSEARYVSGVLILIGLFGTLCGLIAAVGGLQDTILVTQQTTFASTAEIGSFLDGLRNELSVTMAGMKTAFTASLFGVFTTIILSLLLAKLSKSQDLFLGELEEVSTVYLAPLYFPREQTESLDKFAAAMKESSKLLNRVSTRMKTDVGKSEQSFNRLTTLVSRFDEFTGHFQDSQETVQNKLINQITQLGEIIARMDESTGKTVETVNDMALLSKETLSDVKGSMETHRENMDKNARIFEVAIKDFLNRMVQGTLNKSLNDVTTAVEEMKTVNSKLLHNIGDLKDQQTKATDSIAQVQHYFHKDDRLGELRDSIVESTNNVSTSVKEVTEVEKSQAQSLDEMRQLMNRSAAQQAEIVGLTQQLLKSQQNGQRAVSNPLEGAEVLRLLAQIAAQTKRFNRSRGSESQPVGEAPESRGEDLSRIDWLRPLRTLRLWISRYILSPVGGFLKIAHDWSKPKSVKPDMPEDDYPWKVEALSREKSEEEVTEPAKKSAKRKAKRASAPEKEESEMQEGTQHSEVETSSREIPEEVVPEPAKKPARKTAKHPPAPESAGSEILEGAHRSEVETLSGERPEATVPEPARKIASKAAKRTTASKKASSKSTGEVKKEDG